MSFAKWHLTKNDPISYLLAVVEAKWRLLHCSWKIIGTKLPSKRDSVKFVQPTVVAYKIFSCQLMYQLKNDNHRRSLHACMCTNCHYAGAQQFVQPLTHSCQHLQRRCPSLNKSCQCAKISSSQAKIGNPCLVQCRCSCPALPFAEHCVIQIYGAWCQPSIDAKSHPDCGDVQTMHQLILAY